MWSRLCYFCFTNNLLNKSQIVKTLSLSYSATKTHPNCFTSSNAFLSVRRHAFNVTDTNPRKLFHKTAPKPAIPPIVLAILRSALQLIPIVAGRGLRNWWINLPGDKRQQVLQKIKESRSSVIKGGLGFSGVTYIYYYMNLVEDPIMKRRKFMILSNKDLQEMSATESKKIIENYKKKIVKSGPQYDYILNITKKLLKANKTLPGVRRSWQVIVIDDLKTKNALVLPNGHIFVFSGMIAETSNEDQLAVVMGHEIAHVLLQHSAESFSRAYFLQILLLIPFIIIWTFFSDGVASNSQRVTEYMSSVLFYLPFSRKLETEADMLGLEMMARACYDPRQAATFWKKLDELSNDGEIEWLSSHPSHRTRYETLNKLTSKVLRIRTKHCSDEATDSHDPSPNK